MEISPSTASTVHEIKVLGFQAEMGYAHQVERVRQLAGLMACMSGFIDISAFYNEMSNRWILHILWTAADEPYMVSATTADANAILARLTQSARLIRVFP